MLCGMVKTAHHKQDKPGRPPVSEGLGPQEKTPIHNLRVSDAEWGRWKAAADSLGLSLSAWLRDLANKAAKRLLKGK